MPVGQRRPGRHAGAPERGLVEPVDRGALGANLVVDNRDSTVVDDIDHGSVAVDNPYDSSGEHGRDCGSSA